MSGATIQRQRGTYYELTLSTPSMNFAHNPYQQPGEPTDEQRYHAAAAARFEATLAPFDGPLDALLPGLAAAHPGVTLLPLDDSLPQVQGRAEYSLKEHRAQRRGACRCHFLLRYTPDMPAGLDSASLVLAFDALPDDAALEPFLDAVTSEIYRLRREQLASQAPPPDQAPSPPEASPHPPRRLHPRVVVAGLLGLIGLVVAAYFALR